MGLGNLQSLPTTATALGGLVLSLPSLLGLNNPVVGVQPQTAPLPQGYPVQPNPQALIFNYEGEQSVTLESDITDHWIENNSVINDQVALKPELITTHGFIGELNNILPSALQSVQTAANSLLVLSGYAPQLTISAFLALDQAEQAIQTGLALANQAISAFSTISNNTNTVGDIISGPSQNKQQKAFSQFYGWWYNRTLFTVQTPWCIFLNCAIKTLRAIQDADTQLITDFEVTFKVMRFTSLVIAGGIQLGQGLFNNSLAANNPFNVGTSTPLNAGASLTNGFNLASGRG